MPHAPSGATPTFFCKALTVSLPRIASILPLVVPASSQSQLQTRYRVVIKLSVDVECLECGKPCRSVLDAENTAHIFQRSCFQIHDTARSVALDGIYLRVGFTLTHETDVVRNAIVIPVKGNNIHRHSKVKRNLCKIRSAPRFCSRYINNFLTAIKKRRIIAPMECPRYTGTTPSCTRWKSAITASLCSSRADILRKELIKLDIIHSHARPPPRRFPHLPALRQFRSDALEAPSSRLRFWQPFYLLRCKP